MDELNNQPQHYFQDDNDQAYPQGDAAKSQIDSRHRKGFIWRILFMAALMTAIVVLVALMFSIANDSFGYVVVISKIDPERLALNVINERLLTMPNTQSSEDDTALAKAIAADPQGIGFFGSATYEQNRDALKPVAVDGITPDRETAVSQEYPLTRPLYLYTTADILAENQAADVFLNYLITHAPETADGYLPASESDLAQAQQNWLQANPALPIPPGTWPAINPAGIDGRLTISGSSTLAPLIEQTATQLEEAGFAAEIHHEVVGSTAGLEAFCRGDVDIATASRPIQSDEIELCRENGRFPQAYPIAADALTVVANPALTFLDNLSREELAQLFAEAETWQEINPAWPAAPIHRYLPGADSGTLDFFARQILQPELAALPTDDLVRLLAANISVGRGRALEREQRFYQDKLVFDNPAAWNEACSQPKGARPSGCTAPPRTQAEIYDLVVQEVVQPDVVETFPLYDTLLKRESIQRQMAAEYPNGALQFRSWLTTSFITDPQSSTPEAAGVRTAILGSLWVIVITILFSFPVGVGAAVYLEEYAADNKLNRILQTNINNLAGVPSIIYGMLGLVIFVRALEIITSGALFGLVDSTASANGRTILSAGFTLGLLILPLIIINA
ncbi:MAG TPA: hypothetical protein EYP41_22180, partial [Anaerolineae bacterium]|nr:hypothetical protein [Anaerolineae bacterium]